MAVCSGERWFLLAAALAGVRAAGMEAATVGRAVRARHIALKHQALTLERRIWDRDGGEQRVCVRMPGLGEQRTLVSELHDLAEVHHRSEEHTSELQSP